MPVFAEEVLTTESVLNSASPADWRKPDQKNLLYVQLENGEVIFEVAPAFAPKHIANIRQLVIGRYFDGLPTIRSQDNYVVQWGDPAVGTEAAKKLGAAKMQLEPEFFRNKTGLNINNLDSRDAYADEVALGRHIDLLGLGLLFKAHLHRVVTVARHGFNLHDRHRPGLHDRDRDTRTVLGEDLGHPNLAPQHSANHYPIL